MGDGAPKVGTGPVKNKWKKRLEVLEKTLTDGIDRIVLDIRNIYNNEQVLAAGLDELDENTATIRALLVAKGVFTDEEFDAKKQELQNIKARVQAKRQEEQEKAEELARQKQDAERRADDGSNVDPELLRIKKAAEVAGQDSDHPEGAFIFGGS